MANKIYPKWKEAVIQAASNSSLAGTLKVALVDTATYIYADADEFLTSLSGVVGTAQTIGTKTFVNGTLDGGNVTFTAVTGATVEALVLYLDTGVAGTSRLVAHLDTSVIPNGGDITITWNASGIFTI